MDGSYGAPPARPAASGERSISDIAAASTHRYRLCARFRLAIQNGIYRLVEDCPATATYLLFGPKFTKRDRRAAKLERSYYVHQVEYCQNFVFARHHPIRKIFERSCELGLWRLTGERIWRAFGRGHRDRITGKLQTIMEALEHGPHIFRTYWKRAWVKQYEKYSTYLRNEVTSTRFRAPQERSSSSTERGIREGYTDPNRRPIVHNRGVLSR